jgi:CubicO group peptidase (beta-lactamase class C family)
MKRSFLVFTFVLISSLSPAGHAQGQSVVPGATVDALFANWNKPDSPGCALVVIKDGHAIYKRGYGSASLDYGTPISAHSVFNIGSASKQFTAASVALLAQQGKITLDEDIRKYLPELPQSPTRFTVRQLIYHTSGIREYSHLMQLAGIRFQDASDKEVFETLARQREPNFEPGTEYSYSNSGYFLLAQIVKKASGKSLGEFANENIFKPLGMSSTRFYDDNTEVIKNRAVGYSQVPTGGFSVERTVFNHVGNGGLFTTIDDLAIWDRNFYENKLSGGQELIDRLLTQGSLNNGEKLNYVFGLDVEEYRGAKLFGHGGAYNGFNADMIRFPDQRFSVICLCNLSNVESGRLTRQVADIYLADVFTKRESAGATASPAIKMVPEKELHAVEGSYFRAAASNLRRIYVKDGKLIYSRGSSESELAPLGSNRFILLGVPDRVEISFIAPRPGGPLQMRTSVSGVKPIVHERVEPVSYTPEQLSRFAGTYYSEEIDATYTISLQAEKLILRRKNVDDAPLQLLFADTFASVGSGTLTFTRNDQKQVSGFLVNTGRVRKLRFNKI